MKSLLVLFLWCFCAMAKAKCIDTDGGREPKKAGQVLVDHSEACPNGQDCLRVSSREKDFCLDKIKLREYWCEGEQLKMEDIVCDSACSRSECK